MEIKYLESKTQFSVIIDSEIIEILPLNVELYIDSIIKENTMQKAIKRLLEFLQLEQEKQSCIEILQIKLPEFEKYLIELSLKKNTNSRKNSYKRFGYMAIMEDLEDGFYHIYIHINLFTGNKKYTKSLNETCILLEE